MGVPRLWCKERPLEEDHWIDDQDGNEGFDDEGGDEGGSDPPAAQHDDESPNPVVPVQAATVSVLQQVRYNRLNKHVCTILLVFYP